ncbi:Hypothetical predicted protein [Octopus vulgaris]|uniref:Uncharacterized protein n=1 Tax=Octopus vulgaris TaxID=6645 RepID=A0AA36AM07_OCTVU|nr:Hypothetical predicted protein [Octopus vulgaris]
MSPHSTTQFRDKKTVSAENTSWTEMLYRRGSACRKVGEKVYSENLCAERICKMDQNGYQVYTNRTGCRINGSCQDAGTRIKSEDGCVVSICDRMGKGFGHYTEAAVIKAPCDVPNSFNRVDVFTPVHVISLVRKLQHQSPVIIKSARRHHVVNIPGKRLTLQEVNTEEEKEEEEEEEEEEGKKEKKKKKKKKKKERKKEKEGKKEKKKKKKKKKKEKKEKKKKERNERKRRKKEKKKKNNNNNKKK